MAGAVVQGRTRWRRRQLDCLRRLAGRVPLTEMAQAISAAGPPRSAQAVRRAAERRGIDWRHGGRRTVRADHRQWSEHENALLRALAGHRSAEEIAEALYARFETVRTPGACRRQANALGLSMVRDGIGLSALRAALGVGYDRIRQEVADGRLRAEMRGNGQRGSLWLFWPSDVEAWIRAYPYLLNWRRIRRSGWRDLARAAALGMPYLTITETAAHLRINRKTVQQWVREGRVPGVLDVGTAKKPLYRIPFRALDQIEHLARALAHRSEAAA